MYSSQVSRPRAPSSAKSRPHLKQLGSRLAPASNHAQFISAVREPRPLACFGFSSGNSGGTGGCEVSTAAAGPWCTIGTSGNCMKTKKLLSADREQQQTRGTALPPMALLMAPRTEVHERTQISANARQQPWTRINNTKPCEPQGQRADWLYQPET